MRRIAPPMRLASIVLVLLMTASLCGCSGCDSAPRPDLVEVIVAARDLPLGITLQETDIKIVNIPLSDLPPRSPRRKSDVVGHKILVRISKGVFISLSQVDR